METITLEKYSLKTWLHKTSDKGDFILSRFTFTEDFDHFRAVELNGTERNRYHVSQITIVDKSVTPNQIFGAGAGTPYSSMLAVSLKLEAMLYPPFQLGNATLTTVGTAPPQDLHTTLGIGNTSTLDIVLSDATETTVYSGDGSTTVTSSAPGRGTNKLNLAARTAGGLATFNIPNKAAGTYTLATLDDLTALGGGGVTFVTYAQLTTLISTNSLVIGGRYGLTDYITTYTQPTTLTAMTADLGEPLILTAIDYNKLDKVAESYLYPHDTVYYDVTGNIGDGYGTEGSTKGKIYRRVDNLRNNDIGTDWRAVKYRRGGLDVPLFADYTGVYNNFIGNTGLFNNVIGSYFNDNRFNSMTNSNIGNFCSHNAMSSVDGLTMGNNCIGLEATAIGACTFPNTTRQIKFLGVIQFLNLNSFTAYTTGPEAKMVKRLTDGNYQLEFVDGFGDTNIIDL